MCLVQTLRIKSRPVCPWAHRGWMSAQSRGRDEPRDLTRAEMICHLQAVASTDTVLLSEDLHQCGRRKGVVFTKMRESWFCSSRFARAATCSQSKPVAHASPRARSDFVEPSSLRIVDHSQLTCALECFERVQPL
jgi:hypothetical protein